MLSQDGISYPHPPSTSINGFVQDNTSSNNYLNPNPAPNPNPNPNPENTSSANKRKRSLPGNPDPDAEVVALSPTSLMATNRFICEVCNKGFQREQNLQLHRRGHNLPWKLKQKSKDPVRKKVYLCPEKSCVHHDPSRALGDLTGIKKHFSRKHGEKKWKCEKCSKKYAVMSDWKAHSKICGTREYKCDCGTIFSRKDSFITHRAFCDALTEERMRVNTNITAAAMNQNFRVDMMNGSYMPTPQSMAGISPYPTSHGHRPDFLSFESSSSGVGNNNNIIDGLNKPRLPLWLDHNANPPQAMSSHLELHQSNTSSPFLASSSSIGRGGQVLPEYLTSNFNLFSSPPPPPGSVLKNEEDGISKQQSNYNPQSLISLYSSQQSCSMSATALLQKAAQIGSTRSDSNSTVFANTSGMMRTTSNSHQLAGFGSMSSMTTTNEEAERRELFRQEANRQQQQLRRYSAADQLMMMGGGDAGGGGMRDFLGTLGGGSNDQESNINGGGDEMAYKLATTMAAAHPHPHNHQQEPYMDLMR